MVIDEFLQALGVESLPTDFQSLDFSVQQSNTAMLDVASLCAGLSDALEQAQKSVSVFGTETVMLATLMQQAAESGGNPLQTKQVQSVLTQAQSNSTAATLVEPPSAGSSSTSLFASASNAFVDLDAQSDRLAQSWQRFLQNQDVGAFAQSLYDIGDAVAGDADQLTSAQQEVVDFFKSIGEGIGYFADLQTAVKGVWKAMKAAAPVAVLMELPIEAIAAAVVAVGAALVYAYRQYQAFKAGATDGALYGTFTQLGEMLTRIGGLWRYIMDEASKSMLKIKASLPDMFGGGLSKEEQQRLNQLNQKTSKGLGAYEDEAVSQYRQKRQETEAHARQQQSSAASVPPLISTAPALADVIQQPPSVISAVPLQGMLRHRSPASEFSGTLSPETQSTGATFYIDTMNVAADTPTELADSVAQQAEGVRSRNVSTMLSYSRGKGARP
jgi:hypothetical protein